ncbi:plant expansin [Armillaria nabsnona]|nr:plant expansin [Armillaria nabsnona]
MFFTRILAFLSVFALLAAALPLVPRANVGEATYYLPGLGSCGVTNTVSDMSVAVSHLLYDSYPYVWCREPHWNPLCGKKLVATYGGKSVTVMVTDRCEGCAGMYDLDFTPNAFSQLASTSLGRLTGVDWDWA